MKDEPRVSMTLSQAKDQNEKIKYLQSQVEKVTKENFLNESLTVSQQKDINTLLSQVEGLRKEIALIANDQLKSPYKRIELIRKSLKKKV